MKHNSSFEKRTHCDKYMSAKGSDQSDCSNEFHMNRVPKSHKILVFVSLLIDATPEILTGMSDY